MTTAAAKISQTGRWFAALIASVGWLSLAMQLSVSHQLLTVQGFTFIEVIWRMLGYFTILSNILVAMVMTGVALNRWPGGARMSPAVLAATMIYIVCVGVFYHLLLAQLYDLSGLAWLADTGLHSAIPLMTLVWWLLFCPKSGLRAHHIVWWLAYPLAYCAAALVRGQIAGWYPYPFIDAAALGLPKALLNSALLTLAFLLMGAIIVVFSGFATRKSG